MSYSQLIDGLNKAKITLNRKQLSEIAIHDPKAFDALVAEARSRAQVAPGSQMSDHESLLGLIADAKDPAVVRKHQEFALEQQKLVPGLFASIPGLPPAERKAMGQKANDLKRSCDEVLAACKAWFEEAALEAERSGAGFDATIPGKQPERGSLHPLTRVTRELEDLFTSMGYVVLDGPEVELDWYNFEALNIPRDHPARDMQDTFRCDPQGNVVLRTHTSPGQVRAMERMRPPFRAIVPGKVFRQET